MALSPADRRDLRKAAKRMAEAEQYRASVIRRAVTNGGSAREVAAECGISHTWVLRVAKAAEEAEEQEP